MKKYLYPDHPLKFILLIVICIFISTPFAFLSTILEDSVFTNIIIIVFTTSVTVISFYTFKYHNNQLFAKHLLKTNISINMIIVVLCFQLMINIPLTLFLESINSSEIKQLQIDNQIVLLLFSMILIGPVCEEWIFRGIFLRVLQTKYSNKIAIVISAVIFALIHVKYIQMFGALFFGLYFGYIFVKTKSLSNVMILHIVANFVGTIGRYIVVECFF